MPRLWNIFELTAKVDNSLCSSSDKPVCHDSICKSFTAFLNATKILQHTEPLELKAIQQYQAKVVKRGAQTLIQN